MEIIWSFFVLIGSLMWLAILLVPWRPWHTDIFLDSDSSLSQGNLDKITVLIPARNEMETIELVCAGLEAQGSDLNIILIDDRSKDSTVEVARKAVKGKGLRIISGRPLPPGWTGKLWALEQGLPFIKTPLTLLIDADIKLQPGILIALEKTMKQNGIGFASLMAEMRMVSFWERLLMPAFVYFFKLIYPFRLSNSSSSKIAAAAGGCILVETRLLREIGGFQALRGELIDDCALAKKVKSMGHKTWIGLTHSVQSLRAYNGLGAIWDMVARTAFTQLDRSCFSLIVCTLIMVMAFWSPVIGLLFPGAMVKVLALAGLGAMIWSYLPTLKFYGVSKGWALAFPVVGTLYLAMTWASAIQYWFGEGSHWKGRAYANLPDSN
ncbi:MAG: glycosyltransferase [Nitrospiraceae bacterium]|nr:glycosyltransferase [Nitrospiraceae bacterium]